MRLLISILFVAVRLVLMVVVLTISVSGTSRVLYALEPNGSEAGLQVGSAASGNAQAREHAHEEGQGRGFGMGGGLMGGRGVEGTVTSVTASELTIKTELGESYKVQFNQNTRFMKDRQPAGSSDVKLGDSIMAAGNIDARAKTVGAAFVATLDADQLKQIKEARASYGKTWLAGRITAIEDTRITIAGADGKPASLIVDENTSFRKRKESITLGDVKVGDSLTARGALKGGSFVATEFQLMEPRGERGPHGGAGDGPGSSPDSAPGGMHPHPPGTGDR